ncbi:Gfo/Idh/MocA family oxidoreductase [uncultured Algibacter sp.]|uniref:Gfo/Idh/MocA family protein n=1 Tax=uncultured Algibacter sp. TaxID=298659 RepID=UPI002631B979|nr:Gfo/Idh/MocA family oxidoreductase [uncultured Algibacter sp.]
MTRKTNFFTRRDFIKDSSLATGGILLAPSILSATSPLKSKTNTLKLAIVGCGGRGTGAVLQALNADKDVKLVAMADVFKDKLDKSFKTLSEHIDANRIPVKESHKFTGFGSYKKAIDEADVIILTTPPGFRPQHFEYAVAQGKHVFMEKPVATDVAGVKKVLEAAKVAKAKKLNVVVGLQRHYQNSYQQIYKHIQKGKIGKIVSGQVYWNTNKAKQPIERVNYSELEHQLRNWYYFNWICGDHILEQHIHNIDVANWFIGEYPIKAQGMGGREVRTGNEYGQIFDHHFVEFTYPSGAVISSQSRQQLNCLKRISETFQGTKGIAETDNRRTSLLKSYSGKTIYKHDTQEDKNPYQVEHDNLFDSIRNGGVISDAENAAKSTMTGILGRMATYSGQEITWDAAMNTNLKLVPDENTLTMDSLAPVLPDNNGNYPIPVPGKTLYF